MTALDLSHFRKRLETRREELLFLSVAAKETRKPVELDQQSVGRLSRMDALQQQAMAKSHDARRAGELRKIKAALARIEKGEYGYCAECGEAISPKRLEIDLTAARCAPCAGAV